MTAPHAPDVLVRPSGACVLCKPPLGARPWPRAYSGHLTCEHCEGNLESTLQEIADRYEKLDPRPGGQGELGGRGAPGFGSRAPASEHIIAMMDPRSSEVAKVWVAADMRVHRESERPPLSVYSMLLREVYEIAEQREMSLPEPGLRVRHLTEWLSRHVEWVTRQDSVVEFAEVLKALKKQLRPVTGDKPKRPFAECPNILDKSICGGPLFAPPTLAHSTIRCQSCGRGWVRGKPSVEPGQDEWEHLGSLVGMVAA